MPRIIFDNIAISLTAASPEEAYAQLDRALRAFDPDADPAMTTDTYEVWDDTLDARLLRSGETSDLY